jgi:HAMP domain-containing protein
MKKKSSLSWRIKLPLLMVLFATAPLAAAMVGTLDLFSDTFEENTLKNLGAVAKAKAEAIDQFTATRISEAEKIAQLVAPLLQDVLRREKPADPEGQPLPTLQDEKPPDAVQTSTVAAPQLPPSPPSKALQEALGALRRTIGLILWDQAQFEEILILTAEGRVVASTFPGHENRTAAEIEYFKAGLRASHVAPVFVSPITDRLTMVISTPVRDDTKQVIGVLAARLNLVRFFRLINEATGLGETGETVVGKLIGEEVVMMAPTRHDADAALVRKIRIEGGADHHLVNAARGLRGFGAGQDYRGKLVYAAWEYVPTLEWGLAVKIDAAEAMSPVSAAGRSAMILAGLIVLVAFGAAFAVALMVVRPIEKLKLATDRISRGDFDVELDIRPGDEIGDLAESFERMVAGIRFFRAQSRGEPEPDEIEPSKPREK